MAFCISEECISCGECAGKCPASAIKECDKGYAIEASQCTDCGSCASVCPVAAAKKL